MANYYTTSSSNLAGLAARAYKSSLNFREAHTQILRGSIYLDLFRSRSSQLFFTIFDTTPLLSFFNSTQEISNYFLVNKNHYGTLEKLCQQFVSHLEIILDTHSYYDFSLVEFIKAGLDSTMSLPDSRSTAKSLIQNVIHPQIELFYEIIRNNHFSKISDVPDNTVLKLSTSIDLDKNWRGTSILHTEIPPQQYTKNEVYRSSATLDEYQNLSQNYSAYLGTQILNPTIYNGVESENYPETAPSSNLSLVNVNKGIYA